MTGSRNARDAIQRNHFIHHLREHEAVVVGDADALVVAVCLDAEERQARYDRTRLDGAEAATKPSRVETTLMGDTDRPGKPSSRLDAVTSKWSNVCS
jgi:hypothetical protein